MPETATEVFSATGTVVLGLTPPDALTLARILQHYERIFSAGPLTVDLALDAVHGYDSEHWNKLLHELHANAVAFLAPVAAVVDVPLVAAVDVHRLAAGSNP